MKDRFLNIKALGVVTDSWMINNRGDVIHSQLQGSINKKMLAEISQKVLQLLALQTAYIGPHADYIALECDEEMVFGFDLGALVLVAITSSNAFSASILSELQAIAQSFREDSKLLIKYEKKAIERREQVNESKLDEKGRGLLQELRKSNF